MYQWFDISYEAYLGHGDSSLFKLWPWDHTWVTSMGQSLTQTIKEINLKNLLVNCKYQSFDISYEASLGHGDSSLFKLW